jgi:hypothetical protein
VAVHGEGETLTTTDRIRVRLSPAQIAKLADLLDDICDGTGGSFVVTFRARGCKRPVVYATYSTNIEIGGEQLTGQGELPLNSSLTRTT